ncbi:MAG: hypothetical protein EPN43_10990 [Jatrophihabitans sp.]|nr:MAG: hypothetical protein EPN43_10990 [Jatrophihabitans sp.]
MGVTCSLCGRVPDPLADGDPRAPLGWCSDTAADDGGGHAGRRTRWTCGPCTRDHLRAIEAKLEQRWW